MNKIIKVSLAEKVSQRLQSQIESSDFKVGDKLPTEPVLMEQFGVGRSSIREAVKILENKGLVNVQQGVGTFVASKVASKDSLTKQLQTASVKDVNEVRDLLEIKIVEKAALNRTADDIRELKQILKKRNLAADRNDLIKWIEEDIAFHIKISEASKNTILSNLYKTFAEQELKNSIEERYSKNISMHRMTAIHEDLFNAIVDNSPENAVKAILEMRKLD
ncbi:FadR/GntR family transcriptional regulator [Chryseobacterium sp. JAH]|uniref:FadR/GntR family transcriptional regulator n=1 Tax=Chryseobacterium sp. JAH TaxID=1742858 RepID=UPI000740F6D9|nr:FadR/GntR family transcriptional regulator [Chryseobacterium sp. JAH]KUJ50015.1 hypothetical protein AR685_16635 [Chryseobacterium sp. JAH]